MSLERTNKYGKITVLDKVFEYMIADLCQKPKLYDRIWLAQKPNIKSSYNDEGHIELSFSVYVKFGQSIRETCQTLARMVAKIISDRTGEYPQKIKINVAGVRSQTLTRRNIDYTFKFVTKSKRSKK